MTVIAGVASRIESAESDRLTRRIIEEQRAYCSDSVCLRSVDGATLGTARLKTTGQLVLAETAHWLITADIRLDNRDELRERVASAQSVTDGELLLAAWIEAGVDGLSWIAGDFALAIFNSRDSSLTLARDVTGRSPLFYARSAQAVAFASMPAGLRSFVGALRVNKSSLARAAYGVALDGPQSYFEAISRVPPGHLVRLAPGIVDQRPYWNPETAAGKHSPRVTVEEFRSVLDQSVGDRLKHCSRPVATHLSSGFDSSSVTATAARLLRSPDSLIAFTSAPSAAAPIPDSLRRIADESGIAAQTAATLGIRHVVVRDIPPIADVIREHSILAQEPALNAHNLAWWLQIRRQAAAIGADCLLTGELGNFTLNAGGLPVLREWIRRGEWQSWWKQAKAAAGRPDTRWRGVLYNSFHPWLPVTLSSALERVFLGVRQTSQITFLRPEWRAHGERLLRREPRDEDYYSWRVRKVRTYDQGSSWKAGLVDGVDERDPMSDRRLIELSLKIPPEQLYWDGVIRPLAREGLSDRLPRSVIDLPARGLQAADWALRFTRDEASALLEEISVSSTAQELLDLDRMRGAISRWPTQDWNRSSVYDEYRTALVGGLAIGMFAAAYD